VIEYTGDRIRELVIIHGKVWKKLDFFHGLLIRIENGVPNMTSNCRIYSRIQVIGYMQNG
jgi:ribosomal protein L19